MLYVNQKLTKRQTNIITWYFLLLLVAIISFTVAYFTNGVELCTIYRITKIPCPGCGMATAFYKLIFLHDLKGAFLSNCLFWTIPILPIILELKNQIYKNIILFLFVVLWIFRVLTYFF